MKTTFIAWTTYDRRPELLAQHLGASLHYIAYGQRNRALQAPLRYVVQALQTWHVLREERPDIVFAQNPPIFCPMVAALYARRHGARLVVDSHSGAFIGAKWSWSRPLHRLLSRGAVTTIVQNRDLLPIVGRWGCPISLLGFTPGTYPAGDPPALEGTFNAAVVSTFAEDEPLADVIAAAQRLPAVHFYVTGDSRRASPQLLATLPGNCHLTGYIPYERYVGLLRAADVVIDLTTRDHTLLMGAYEAVSLGTPLITSDWPILREYFSQGTIHIPNTVEGICAGLARAREELATLRRGIAALQAELQAEWLQQFAALRRQLEADCRGKPPVLDSPRTADEHPPYRGETANSEVQVRPSLDLLRRWNRGDP